MEFATGVSNLNKKEIKVQIRVKEVMTDAQWQERTRERERRKGETRTCWSCGKPGHIGVERAATKTCTPLRR